MLSPMIRNCLWMTASCSSRYQSLETLDETIRLICGPEGVNVGLAIEATSIPPLLSQHAQQHGSSFTTEVARPQGKGSASIVEGLKFSDKRGHGGLCCTRKSHLVRSGRLLCDGQPERGGLASADWVSRADLLEVRRSLNSQEWVETPLQNDWTQDTYPVWPLSPSDRTRECAATACQLAVRPLAPRPVPSIVWRRNGRSTSMASMGPHSILERYCTREAWTPSQGRWQVRLVVTFSRPTRI